MSIIPEVILHNVIVRGLREIRRDPRILDVLFKNLDQQTLQAIKDSVLNQAINFTVNYPRISELKTPTIALLLKTEREAEVFLGDMMGASPNYGVPDQEHTIDTLGGHGGSVTDLQGLPTKVIGGIRPAQLEIDEVANITTVTFLESQREDIATILGKFAKLPCLRLYVASGTGAGQIFTILRMDSISLDIEGTFDPQLDNSSVLDVRLAEDTGLAIGEPSRVYPAGATNLYRRGANFSVQYQLNVLAGSQDEAIYLYTILKSLLFSQKMFMEQQGIMALKVSGSDFAPRTEFLPNEIFQRVLNIEFIYPFSFLQEQDTASQIQLTLSADNANNGGTCGEITIEVEFGATTTI